VFRFDLWTIRENIRRFRELLKDEPDGEKRRTLERLLAEEEARLPPKEEQHPS
jgi:hypothetical protein